MRLSCLQWIPTRCRPPTSAARCARRPAATCTDGMECEQPAATCTDGTQSLQSSHDASSLRPSALTARNEGSLRPRALSPRALNRPRHACSRLHSSGLDPAPPGCKLSHQTALGPSRTEAKSSRVATESNQLGSGSVRSCIFPGMVPHWCPAGVRLEILPPPPLLQIGNPDFFASSLQTDGPAATIGADEHAASLYF